MSSASSSAPTYPVQVSARLDAPLSRWLWLVKWLLAIPHWIVLAFLWLGFLAVSVVALVAILVTGRYPRVMFDYAVGVLRWSWRVTYYSYGGLGTDRYPPFTLADVPDYPARLDLPYPERLSRGLVLVKWWLLAIPHYVVVAVFLGGATYAGGRYADVDTRYSWPGLIGILVLVAAVVLLVTGRYPGGVFDLVVGLNRWVLRVVAYAGLLTDTYPPFRLDLGGPDPGGLGREPQQAAPAAPARAARGGATSTLAPPSASTATATAAPTLTGGRVVAIVVGGLVGALAVSLLAAGAVTAVVDRTQRDADGFLRTPTQSLATSTAGLVSGGLDLRLEGPDVLYGRDLLGDVELRVTGDGTAPVFVGVADRAAASTYLAGFRHEEVTRFGGAGPTTTTAGGTGPAPAPGTQGLWAASASGPGPQTLRWTPTSGDWVAVVMNADGSPGVRVTADAGAQLPVLRWVWIALLVTGAVLLAGAALPIALAARRR